MHNKDLELHTKRQVLGLSVRTHHIRRAIARHLGTDHLALENLAGKLRVPREFPVVRAIGSFTDHHP
jgi:hypothetical protein